MQPKLVRYKISKFNILETIPIIGLTRSTVEYQEGNILSAICQGDSGGPLVHKDKLFGAVSYNSPPCNGGLPNFFVSLAHFLEDGWIGQNSDYNPDATND